MAAGDTFLLCSDGLSGPVQDDELGVIMGCLPPAEAVRVLVDLANLRGGPDNITVLIARVKTADVTGGGAVFNNDLNVSESGSGLTGVLAWIACIGLLLATGVMVVLKYPGVAWATGSVGGSRWSVCRHQEFSSQHDFSFSHGRKAWQRPAHLADLQRRQRVRRQVRQDCYSS